MDILKGTFVILDCPLCQYGMDVELISVRMEVRVFCPCCKAEIQLLDGNASTYKAQAEVESAIKDLTISRP